MRAADSLDARATSVVSGLAVNDDVFGAEDFFSGKDMRVGVADCSRRRALPSVLHEVGRL